VFATDHLFALPGSGALPTDEPGLVGPESRGFLPTFVLVLAIVHFVKRQPVYDLSGLQVTREGVLEAPHLRVVVVDDVQAALDDGVGRFEVPCARSFGVAVHSARWGGPDVGEMVGVRVEGFVVEGPDVGEVGGVEDGVVVYGDRGEPVLGHYGGEGTRTGA